jgi:hypothetical protein
MLNLEQVHCKSGGRLYEAASARFITKFSELAFYDGRYTLISKPLVYGRVEFMKPFSGVRRNVSKSL